MLLNKLPPDALLLIAVFLGSTIRSIRNEKIDPWHGLKAAFGSAVTAWLLVAGICDYFELLITLWVASVGAGVAYMGSEVLGAIERYGRMALDNPFLLLKDWLPPAISKFFSPTVNDKPHV